MENGLTMFRYLFAHETAFGLLTLAGVPNPNHYGIILILSFPMVACGLEPFQGLSLVQMVTQIIGVILREKLLLSDLNCSN